MAWMNDYIPLSHVDVIIYSRHKFDIGFTNLICATKNMSVAPFTNMVQL